MVNEELKKIEAQDVSIVVLDNGMESPDGISCCWAVFMLTKGP